MTRSIAFLYRLGCYAICFAVCLYAVGFVAGLAVPKTIDTGTATSAAEAFAVNSSLLGSFAIQHSVMARNGFKQWWTRFIPAAAERHTYFLCSSLALALLFWQWRPMPAPVWQIADPTIAIATKGFSVFGWLIVRTMCFIKHFELFGLRQVARKLAGSPAATQCFRSPLLRKLARHPIYLGFIIAFWAAPTMTTGHLLFAAMTTAYIFVTILLEGRELVGLSGRDRRYDNRVSMLVPRRKSASGLFHLDV
jgi:protein-S-isoprenylcysteine O-methyltransferase Ste14